MYGLAYTLLVLMLGASSRPGKAEPTGAAPVRAVVPKLWAPPRDRGAKIDFALASEADAWLRHGALGDPSFDSFQHRAGNPIVRGQAPFTWPVNGFLFEDPNSGYWYAYVGQYLTGYDIGPGLPIAHCDVYRSQDRGATWKDLGPIFDDPQFRFEGDTQPANGAPDVTVVYADGRYHLAYDWFTDNSTWADVAHPHDGMDSGCAYAWADRPEGPFHRAPRPILRASEMPRRFALGRKYYRAYGATIIHRRRDWLVLALCDSGEYYSWGVMAMTAKDLEGAWSDPVLVLGVEGSEFYPPTSEGFPAMVYDGYVYVASTSVALNRDFQVVYRAPIEQAHRPEAWRLFEHGTAWHSDYVPNEGVGIWGQTYSGFVDRGGTLQVLFPSRERESNLGTINLASRPWNRPLHERGFVLSGHQGPSLTLLRRAWRSFHLTSKLTLQGGAARIIWGYQAPLGPDRHAADSTIHPLSLTNHRALELSANAWRLLAVDAAGQLSVTADGSLEPATERVVEIDRKENGLIRLMIDHRERWQGNLPVQQGPLGLMVEPWTRLSVSEFVVDGPGEPAVLPWLFTEALTGAGVTMADWEVVSSPMYRFATGAVRNGSGGRVKWNFRGRGFRLWSPRGPEFGRCELLLDGRKLAEIDLHAEQDQPSRMVFSCEDAGDGYHAVVLSAITGRLVVDSLDALN